MGKKNRKKNAAAGITDANGKPPVEKNGKAAPPPQNTVREYAKSIGIALAIALLLKQFVFQAFKIPTGSMEDTLLVGDHLFVNMFLYGAKTPERIKILRWTLIKGLPVLQLPAIRQPRQGDIIVFDFPENRSVDYIKRCVAVAGDTVAVRDGNLLVNGELYESNFGDRDGDHGCVPIWTDPEACPTPRTKHDQVKYQRKRREMESWPWPWTNVPNPYVVPEGHIFMMGDNRYNSADSRYWGALDVKLVKGKAMFLYWSWNKDTKRPRLSRMGDILR